MGAFGLARRKESVRSGWPATSDHLVISHHPSPSISTQNLVRFSLCSLHLSSLSLYHPYSFISLLTLYHISYMHSRFSAMINDEPPNVIIYILANLILYHHKKHCSLAIDSNVTVSRLICFDPRF